MENWNTPHLYIIICNCFTVQVFRLVVILWFSELISDYWCTIIYNIASFDCIVWSPTSEMPESNSESDSEVITNKLLIAKLLCYILNSSTWLLAFVLTAFRKIHNIVNERWLVMQATRQVDPKLRKITSNILHLLWKAQPILKVSVD